MTIPELVSAYLRLRGELAGAYSSPDYESCRLGHIDRLSRELGEVELALEEAGIDDALFECLLSGRPGWDGATPIGA